MAGHSKWAQIKRSKAVKDAKKGATFARYAREIMKATALGGADPAGNFRLRTAIEHAKAAGLPNDNIARAIAKGAGQGTADNLETLIYEGYGPGGAAILIETMTDNRNRTAGDIRSYFNKCQGNLGSDGCVAWIFEEKGQIVVKQQPVLKAGLTEETFFELAIESGATDFEVDQETGEYLLSTAPSALNVVCEALAAKKIEVSSAEMDRVPQNSVSISDPDLAKPLLKLLDLIESHDDVQNVYCNVELSESLMAQVTS